MRGDGMTELDECISYWLCVAIVVGAFAFGPVYGLVTEGADAFIAFLLPEVAMILGAVILPNTELRTMECIWLLLSFAMFWNIVALVLQNEVLYFPVFVLVNAATLFFVFTYGERMSWRR